MNRKVLKANTSNKTATLFHSNFASAFRKRLDIKHSTNRLDELTINLSEVSEILSKTKTGSLSSDPIPIFVLNSCLDVIAPLDTQVFTVIIKATKWPNLWICSIIAPIHKSRNPKNVRN